MAVCLLLLAPFTVHLAARSVAHAPRRAAAPRLQTADPERSAVSWQEELEQLLAPATGQEEREFLLRDLLSRGPEIADEVRAAVSSGEYADLLPPPDSQSRRLLDDIAVVNRQVLDDLLPRAVSEVERLLDPQELQQAAADVQEVGGEAASQASEVAASEVVSSLLNDPARALELASQEARNVFRRTPEGLETPAFRVLREGNGFQIREYAPFALAVADVDVERAPRGAAGELVAGGRSFTALTSYLFGGNGRGETMAMTTPVFVDVSPAEGVVGAPRAILFGAIPFRRAILSPRASVHAHRPDAGQPSDGLLRAEPVR